MASDNKTQMNLLVKKLQSRGFQVKKHDGHYRVMKPDGTRLATLPGTPSDRRTVDNSYAELRRLGVDVRKSDGKKKGSIDDFALGRLRERIQKQRTRVTRAQLARLAMYVADQKKLPPFGSTSSGEQIVRRIEQGEGRITKSNHNLLAATLKLLESSDDQALEKHVAAADEFLGVEISRRVHPQPSAPKKESTPAATKPEAPVAPTPEPEPVEKVVAVTEIRHVIEFRLPAAERAFIRELLLAVIERGGNG